MFCWENKKIKLYVLPTVEVAPFLKITRPRGGEKRISRPISRPGGVLQVRFLCFLILPAFWQGFKNGCIRHTVGNCKSLLWS